VVGCRTLWASGRTVGMVRSESMLTFESPSGMPVTVPPSDRRSRGYLPASQTFR